MHRPDEDVQLWPYITLIALMGPKQVGWASHMTHTHTSHKASPWGFVKTVRFLKWAAHWSLVVSRAQVPWTGGWLSITGSCSLWHWLHTTVLWLYGPYILTQGEGWISSGPDMFLYSGVTPGVVFIDKDHMVPADATISAVEEGTIYHNVCSRCLLCCCLELRLECIAAARSTH